MMLGSLFGGQMPGQQQQMFDPFTMQRQMIQQRNANYVLRVRAGPNTETMQNIDVNYEHTPLRIRDARVQGLHQPTPAIRHRPQPAYFANGFSRRALYSIQIVGQFLKSGLTADDIIFGNFFDRRLDLPPFSGLYEWFMKRMDRTLILDMKSDKPSACSPLLATVQKLSTWKTNQHGPPATSVPEINTKILREIQPMEGVFDESGRVAENFPIKDHLNTESKKRRQWFERTSHRQHWKIKPDDVYACDFYSPFIDVNNQCVRMPNSIVEPMPYFDPDTPLRYECRTRDGRHTFFAVQFELVPASRARVEMRAGMPRRRVYRDSGYERDILDPPPPYTPSADGQLRPALWPRS
ncbi:hypothetical protein DL89DRAFT_264427, partial [Linderina pennispora]